MGGFGRTFAFASLAAALAAVMPPRTAASPAGFYDAARPGMGCSCHQFGPPGAPVTLVRVFVDGEPFESFAGYEPGVDYRLTVWVIGPVVPLAGFNLEALGGLVRPVDGSVQTLGRTECEHVRWRVPGCLVQTCEIVRDDACPSYDVSNPACEKCPAGDVGDETKCRSCDDRTIVEVQATHTAPKPIPYFEVVWTAPPEPVEVPIFVVGNSVSGDGRAELDFWNFVEPNPLVLRPREGSFDSGSAGVVQ